MAIEKLPYFSGDEIALQAIETGKKCFVDIYEYQKVSVVLGNSIKLDPDINVKACLKEKVLLLRRKGGGGAVVLSPGVWVITACYANKRKDLNIPMILHRIALTIGEGLEQITNIKISLRGMGDLCIGDRKILGSSLYSGRGAILYQGSLMVDNDLSLISKFLNHPSKEPEYRRGRRHEDFVTKLSNAAKINTDVMKQCLLHKLNTFTFNY